MGDFLILPEAVVEVNIFFKISLSKEQQLLRQQIIIYHLIESSATSFFQKI